MDSHESHPLSAALADRIGQAADAAQAADIVALIWQEIDRALYPLIGKLGVAALFKRSLYLTSAAYPWLAGTHEGVQTAMDLESLHSVLAQQSTTQAASAGVALFLTLYELLSSLIGASLTERLLPLFGVHLVSGPNGQDVSS